MTTALLAMADAIVNQQAAMIASAVANDGTLMSPYLVDQVRAPDLSVIDQTDTEELSEPVSAEVADQLTEMMTSVVENGSGRRARLSSAVRHCVVAIRCSQVRSDAR